MVVFVSVVNFRLLVLVLVLVSFSVVGGITTIVNGIVAVLLVLVIVIVLVSVLVLLSVGVSDSVVVVVLQLWLCFWERNKILRKQQ